MLVMVALCLSPSRLSRREPPQRCSRNAASTIFALHRFLVIAATAGIQGCPTLVVGQTGGGRIE